MAHVPGPLVVAAAVSYAANCALGTAVQLRLIDTSRHRWTHHALYIVTSALTGLALAAALVRSSPAGLLLAPASVPLALLPRVGPAAHAVTGLAAAPFYLAAVVAREE